MSRATSDRSCTAGDARCVAQRVVAALSGDVPAFLYGTPASCEVGVGASASLVVQAGSPEAWEAIAAFLDAHQGEPIAGYLGFGLHDPVAHPEGWPAAVLLVPRAWWVVDGTGHPEAAGRCRCAAARHTPASVHDRPDEAAWARLSEAALAFVGRDPARRLTLARRVPLPERTDVLASFRWGAAVPEARALYFRWRCLEIGGVSPEVLAEGDVGCFRTRKLSGTGSRAADPAQDAALRERFARDAKIEAEHAASRDAMAAALAGLGAVEAPAPVTLDLDVLRHRSSLFTTRPRPGATVADCLRSVFPSGAWPTAEGLALRARVEPEPRGPYYGLAGLVEADGAFSFAQVLRAVLRDRRGACAWAGAAFTVGSTADGELAETRLKLGSIRVAERA